VFPTPYYLLTAATRLYRVLCPKHQKLRQLRSTQALFAELVENVVRLHAVIEASGHNLEICLALPSRRKVLARNIGTHCLVFLAVTGF